MEINYQQICETCFCVCIGDVNAGAAIPLRNIPIEGKISFRRIWATPPPPTPRNQDER